MFSLGISRKMCSIIFLLLVIVISLGLGLFMSDFKEGMDEEQQNESGDITESEESATEESATEEPATEEPATEEPATEESNVQEGDSVEDSEFNVTPIESSCSEGMTNYR
jgi:hypothetical protein